MRIMRRLSRAVSAGGNRQETALALTERIAAGAALISSLEVLASSRTRSPSVLDWSLLRERMPPDSILLLKALNVISGKRAAQALEIARTAAAVSLLLPSRAGHRGRGVSLGFLAVSSAVCYRRYAAQSDGSDQLLFQVQAAAAVARLHGSERVANAALWYVALQSCLAYTVAGYSKAAGAQWRSGTAVPAILRTETYGSKRAFEATLRYPAAVRAATVAVMAAECGFPLLYLLKGGRLAPCFVASAGVFHLVNARAMGLGRFLWAFASTYPALLFTADQVARRYGHAR